MKKTPFSNLSEYITYFLELKNNKKELEEFATRTTININGVSYDYLNFLNYVNFNLTSINSSISCHVVNMSKTIDSHKKHWLDDKSKLQELLGDEFFDEFRQSSDSTILSKLSRPYAGIELYIYYKIQSIATNFISIEKSSLIAGIWLWNDKIEDIYNFGWYGIIANVYNNFGIHWFCDRDSDPILYKFAYYALMSCKKLNYIHNDKIKEELTQLFAELNISLKIHDLFQKNQDIIDLIKEATVRFDDDLLGNLQKKLSALKNENLALINKNKQLTDGISTLRQQISELQKSNIYDDAKIEKMIYQIYSLSPLNSDYEENLNKFKSIWNKISPSTKKDIKQSVKLYEDFKSVDLAILPLMRSLEYEFSRNFIQPFHESPYYLEIKKFTCKNPKYYITHNCLIKRGSSHPTIGNIPYIGKCIDNQDILHDSILFQNLSKFLGDKKIVFCEICKNIDTYSIGTKDLKLVDIRNSIAHGDITRIENIDERCYKDISALLYEPPVRLLFSIIENSKIEKDKNQPR